MADMTMKEALDQIGAILEGIENGSIDAYEGARRLWTGFWSVDPAKFSFLATYVNDATDFEELPERRDEVIASIMEETRRLLQNWPNSASDT